jgi:protein-export membrane protein SecD
MRREKIIVILIIALAILAVNLSAPKYWNQSADYINEQLLNNDKLSVSSDKIKIPHFWDKPFKLGLDLQGGTHLLYEANLSKIEKQDYDSSMQGLRDVIERRVNLFGVQEPIVQIQKTKTDYRLIVELAGVQNTSEAIKMIGETPFLEFREQKTESETQAILDKQKEIQEKAKELQEQGKTIEEIGAELDKIENWQLSQQDPYFKTTSLTGQYLKKAELGFDQTTYEPMVLIQFDDEGTKIFKDLTSKNVGKPLAIYIDGFLISAPTVQEAIAGGKAQITGKFTLEEAKELSRNLNAGALPVPIGRFNPETNEFKSGEPLSQQTVGPALGAVSLQKSLKAGMLGFLAIILFMLIFYRLPGILAGFALIIYVALILCLFKIIPVTLTLAGIGGFLLSIGMAVDANILIFSRLREELKEGKSFSLAIEDGFKRAWPAIRDGNITTLVVALILFGFGSSFVKGFALTLSLGILVSMFSAIFITQNFLRCFASTRIEKIKCLWR